MIEKFDSQVETYWDNYVASNWVFYQEIQEHMRESLQGKHTIGLDIGAGPGVAALLADNANLETTIVGIEPSQLHDDGIQLAKSLRVKDSKTTYLPMKCGMDNMVSKKPFFDYVTLLRSSHEIAESLGSKDAFYELLKTVTTLIRPSGVMIIAEPQYAPDITHDPSNHGPIIEDIKRFQKDKIGHSHEPQDYIMHEQMQEVLSSVGLTQENLSILPMRDAHNYIAMNGHKRESPPLLFYVLTSSR